MPKNFLPDKELAIIDRVAEEYGLSPEGTLLLTTIRKVENGRQGREFGVLTPEAMRFEKDADPLKSFETQAKWAAGTIRSRYTGDLTAFANRWAPIGVKNDPTNLNKNWEKNVRFHMNTLKGKVKNSPLSKELTADPFTSKSASEEQRLLGITEQRQREMGGF
jgi:hypothetical protein